MPPVGPNSWTNGPRSLPYFPTKEALVLAPLEEHVDEPARVVRGRAAGESAVRALRRHFLAALAARDAATGLSDDPQVLAVQRLTHSTPALLQHLHHFLARGQELLAEELATQDGRADPIAHVAAAQMLGTRNALMSENIRRLLEGETADAVYPDAVVNAEQAFHLLEHGLGDYRTR
ncbi:TetR family transcriptional regulator [Streptosporangium sp. NPDC020072]|uniref:TetR/AcrR family transcriptional regulator n=1 Tax=Streptosporangium sp. NPDC020072 TaxID=3154788 RepID=UPI0034132D68